MSSPFIPCPFTYGDNPQGGIVCNIIIATRDPSNSIDRQYASGYLWLSDLQQGGSGSLFVQAGNQAGIPNWATLSAGSGGPLNTLSNGVITVSPSGSSNIAIEGTANQISVAASNPSHNLTLSFPNSVIIPNDLTVTDDLLVSGDATVAGTLTVTTGLTFNGAVTINSTLTVTGLTTLADLTQAGTLLLNTTGASATTIGNAAAGAILIDVGVGSLQVNGNGANINIGDDAAANQILIGSLTGLAATHIQSGIGGVTIDGDVAAEIFIGNAAQTGNINLGQSTAGEDIFIGSAINVGAQVISIGNGASAANSTVNILSGTGTAGVGILALGSNPRVTTVGIANVAPLAARVTTIAGGNQAQNDTVTVLGGAPSANTQIFNLLSGAASGGTQTINMFSGNSAAATQLFNLFTGTGVGTINIGTGITGVKTINIGGTAANIISLGNTQTAGSVSLGALMTTGTIALGGAVMTGAITIGAATNATGQTVNVSSAASIAGPNIVNVLAGATPAANQTFNLMTGVGTAGTYTLNVLTGNSTGTTQLINLGTGSAITTFNIGGTGANVVKIADTQTGGSLSLAAAMTTGTISIGAAQTSGTFVLGSTGIGAGLVTLFGGTGAQTINLANNTGIKTINIAGDSATSANIIKIGTGAGAQTLTLGSTNTTSTTTIQAGSGGVNLTGNVNLTSVATKISYNGGAATDFIGASVLTLGTVTIANTNIAATDRIFISRTAVNASTTLGEFTYTINAGVAFTVTSVILGTPGAPETGDVSSFVYMIFGQT